MTFSEKKVVELINKEFIPVWESVAPVTVATYKLDDEREVRGVVNGEIALYFCRPDGKVFDILPALQSPAETLQAMRDALKFYRESDGAKDWDLVNASHQMRLVLLRLHHQSEVAKGEKGLQKRAERIGDAGNNSPSRDLRVAIASKSAVVAPAENFIVVEPGGKFLYRFRVHSEFFKTPGPRSPAEWKETVFETILEMPLEGHRAIYDTSSISPFSIIEE